MLRYIACVMAAEGAGIAVVATLYAALDRGLLPQPAWILAGGAVEGLCLGIAQAATLTGPGWSAWRWVAVTMLGGVAGYALSLLGGAGSAEAARNGDAGIALALLFGLGLGLAMGTLLGGLQALVLPAGLSRGGWVAANALGWMPAMAIIMAAAGLAERHWSLAQVAGLGLVSGALAGACVAGATWAVIRRARPGQPGVIR